MPWYVIIFIFLAGMAVNELHHTRMHVEARKLKALHGDEILILLPHGDPNMVDKLANSGAPKLPDRFGQNLQKNGRAAASRIGGKWNV